MKPVSFALAFLLGAGLLIQAPPAQAETNKQFSNFGERLRQLDVRGGAKTGAAGYDNVRPAGSLPGVFSDKQPTAAPMQMAQSTDASFRVNELEEQVRVLTGKIEEMTFQMLQLQEQIRKMQEDNEFRFQELEQQGSAKNRDSNSNVANTGDQGLGKLQPSDETGSGNGTSSGGNGDEMINRKSITDLLQGDGAGIGAPPAALGTLTFDADGNLVDSNVGKPIDLTKPLRQSSVLPEKEDEMFDLGYSYVQGADYVQAAETFRQFIETFPASGRDQEARFWLGESLLAQGDYEASARIFLANHKANPNAALAPQNLLKLGVSLAGMEQRELACATLAEVPKKYPSMSNAVRKRVEVEQQAAKCKNG